MTLPTRRKLAAAFLSSAVLVWMFCVVRSWQAAQKELQIHDYGMHLAVQDKAKSIVYTLASPDLRGRKFATEEAKTAALFIKNELDAAFHDVPQGRVFMQYFCITPNNDMVCGRNVIAVIDGRAKKDEYVFVTAHYDHLGEENGTIFPGADDNASGTSTVIAVAEAFATLAKDGVRPKRNLVFILFDGEEEGFYGSQYFVTDSLLSFEKMVAVINVDMVGRNDQSELYLVASPDVLDAPARNTDLYKTSLEASAETGLKLLLAEAERDDHSFERSDQASFFFASPENHRLPVIYCEDGGHSDYHKPSDTADKIDYAKIERVARFVFLVALETANRPERPIYKSK